MKICGRPNQAEAMLRYELTLFEAAVAAMVSGSYAETTQAQYDAFVDFAINEGLGALNTSTLLKLHRTGQFAAAVLEFPKWNKAHVDGKLVSLLGLTTRRRRDAALYQGRD